MPIAILQCAGAGLPTYEREETFEKNGEFEILPQDGYGFSRVKVNVSVLMEDSAIIDGSLENCGVPDSVKSIKPYCFYDCSELESVTFGKESECLSIGKYAFSNCSALKTVKIPSQCNSIGESAFEGCTSITTYDLTECKFVPTIGDNAICVTMNTRITVPAKLYKDFCENESWKYYAEYFDYNVMEGVDTDKFDLYLSYETITQAFINNGYSIEEYDQHNYLRVYSCAGSPELFAGVEAYGTTTAGKYLVMKYRSKLADADKDRMTDYMEIWATTEWFDSFSDGTGNRFSAYIQRDGRWHTIVLDIENSLKSLYGDNIKYKPGKGLQMFRVDAFNPQGSETFATDESYFDIAYIGMCDSIAAVKAADPDYTGAGFDYNDLISLLPNTSIGYTDSDMPYANIECTIEHNNYTDPEQIKFIYNDDSVLPNVGRYAAILYTGLQSRGGNGFVQVWLSSKKIRENEENVVAENPNGQIEYDRCTGNEWKYGVANLSGEEYTEDVCRCIRFDYIDGYESWGYGEYNVNLKIAFLKFFDNADDATAYCEAYMRKYGLLEETT